MDRRGFTSGVSTRSSPQPVSSRFGRSYRTAKGLANAEQLIRRNNAHLVQYPGSIRHIGVRYVIDDDCRFRVGGLERLRWRKGMVPGALWKVAHGECR